MTWLWLVAWISTAIAGDLRFAVMPFDNAGGPEFEALGVGLQSMVTTDLARIEGVTVVERARLKDLLTEMKLGQSGVVDPSTAVEVGKVIQATHVVVGSFTVVGETMRLDARASNVATGRVAFEASKTGDREAFFELEAEMVTELLAKVGAELSARDRFRIGRHTADFGAFSTFSRGVALFDAGRYAEARRTLEEASREDPTFELVTVTLADIQAVQERAESKARAARVAEAEEAFVVHQEAAARQATALSDLLALARDPDRTWQQRSAANLLIVTALGWGHTNHAGFSTLRRSSDAFALRRLGEQAYQSLYDELRPRVPEWFPVYVGPNGWFNEERDVDYVFPRNHRRFFEADNHYFNLSSCPDHAHKMTAELFEMLWLPRLRRLDLQREAWQTSKGCMKQRKYLDGMEDLAKDYQRISQYGAATAILDELTKTTDDARRLERIARLAADVRAEAEAMEALPEDSLGREVFANRAARRGSAAPKPAQLQEMIREKLLHEVHYRVRGEIPHRDPLFVSGIPTWLITLENLQLTTGPRTGVDETTSLRHYAEVSRGRSVEPPTVLIIGGTPHTDVKATVTLDFRPADDWWVAKPTMPKGEVWSPLENRPTSGLLVGLREIQTHPICDPLTKKLVRPVPLRGIGALVHDGKLVLAEVTEAYPEPESCSLSDPPLQDVQIGKVLASRPLKRERVRLVVTVDGSEVIAAAGSTRVKAPLPEPPTGFVGLFAKDDGYVELSEPTLE